MHKPRLQLRTVLVAMSIVCAGLAIVALQRYVEGAVAPLWIVPRVFGCAIAGAGLGLAVGELLGGRRGARIGVACGLLLGWNAALLVATASVVWQLP